MSEDQELRLGMIGMVVQVFGGCPVTDKDSYSIWLAFTESLLDGGRMFGVAIILSWVVAIVAGGFERRSGIE